LTANIEPQEQTVDFGRSASMTCITGGNPITSVTWYKDGSKLNHEGDTLTISSVKKEDRGMYQCFVRNDQESAQGTSELKLGGRCKCAELFLTVFFLYCSNERDLFQIKNK
jgi:hypothetical protein